ncbi:MAG: hypothetical protein J5565_04350 [Muribaculaceae bacterium]|nr:hypothetical protein [Muribaculaceae bacterium]
MKRLLYILLGTMVASLATCCHRVSDTEARLIAIDSLVCDQPDSALSLLADINGDLLRGEERAYHALLTVQALYKAYIPATSDTLIRCAWDYYRDHGSYDRRIRAMLYSGTVAEELGHPDSAMRWYKRTELESHPDDHYHRGYALKQMGILYQLNYVFNEAIKKYRNAILAFNGKYPSQYVFCCQQLSQAYQSIDVHNDSSMFFINEVKNISIQNNDTSLLKLALKTEICKLFYDSCYTQAKDLSVKLMNNYSNIPCECWHYVVQSYIKLGMIDSAEMYLEKSPHPANKLDSALYFHSLSLLSSSKGDWKNAHKYEVISDSVAENVVLAHTNQLLLNIEKKVEREYLSSNYQKKQTYLKYYTIAIVAVLLLIVGCILGVVILHKKRTELQLRRQVLWLEENNRKFISEFDKINQEQTKTEQELTTVREELQNQIDTNSKLRVLQTDTEFIKSLYAQLSVTFSQNLQPLGHIASDYFQSGNNATLFMKRFYNHFNRLWSSKDMWVQIENHINNTRNNCFAKFLELHPKISQEEKHLILLLLLGFNSMAITICLGYKSQSVIYSVKSRLKKKLRINENIDDYLLKLEHEDC